MVTCQADGTWGDVAPKCMSHLCSVPVVDATDTLVARIECDSPVLGAGTKCWKVCREGAYRFGPAFHVCEAWGGWSGDAMSCAEHVVVRLPVRCVDMCPCLTSCAFFLACLCPSSLFLFFLFPRFSGIVQFQVASSLATYDEAVATCTSSGGRLSEPTTPEELASTIALSYNGAWVPWERKEDSSWGWASGAPPTLHGLPISVDDRASQFGDTPYAATLDYPTTYPASAVRLTLQGKTDRASFVCMRTCTRGVFGVPSLALACASSGNASVLQLGCAVLCLSLFQSPPALGMTSPSRSLPPFCVGPCLPSPRSKFQM